MIQIFNKDNINFSKNGDMVIHPIYAKFYAVGINKIPTIEMKIPYDRYGAWKYAVNDNVVKCPVPYSLENGDLFRIYETEKDPDGYIFYARHIFGDLMTTTAKDLNNDDVMIVATGLTNGQGAITKLLTNTGFTGYSNITTKIDSVRWDKKQITEALLSDDENSFVTRWGGELFVNNFNVYMNTRVGGDYGVKIAYGKNLDSITENIDYDGIITRIIPTGYNGLRLTGLTPWVDSPNISKYPKVHEKPVEFNNVKVKERPEDEDGFATIELARAELIRLSNLMFTQEHVDVPKVNIKTSMVDVSKTTEYKSMGYSGLEEVLLGDTVVCSHYKIGIETIARCIDYTWNILTKEMINVEIGDVTENFFDKQTNISNAVSKILDGDSVKADKIEGIINALQAKFKAQRSIAQPQEIRAMQFEDLVEGSPTFGATTIGTMGMSIAKNRTPDGKDWDWETFISAGEVWADRLIGTLKTVLIESMDGSVNINLNNGEFRIGSTDGTDTAIHTNHSSTWKHSDGSYTEANADGLMRHNGTTNKNYHYLTYVGQLVVGDWQHATEVTVTVPSEFKGKDFNVITAVQNTGNVGEVGLANLWCQVRGVDRVNGTFNILAYARLVNNVFVNIQFSYTVIA